MNTYDWLEPCLDAEEMRATDGWAIEGKRVPSLELMEAAGEAVAQTAAEVARPGPARVVCGKGNNGGDGLVAARRLRETGFEVEALLLWPAGEASADAAANLERLGGATEIAPGDASAALADSGVVVDAIFGTGFSGAPREPASDAIESINGSGAPVVAADIPSGVNASTGEIEGAAVDADATVTFHRPKLGHYVAPGKWHSGEVRVEPIGIPEGSPVEPASGLIGIEVLDLAPKRGRQSTKFSSGQVVVVGGSRGLTGAVWMSVSAAMRAGAGYATAAVPEDLESIFEVKLTEAMSRGLPSAGGSLDKGALDAAMEACERAGAVVLGPGMGRGEGALELARTFAGRIEAPLVIDADGLNAHAGRLGDLSNRREPTILTPHAGELGRLLERDSDEVAARRLQNAREAAEASGAIVVLKGDDTIVTDGESTAVNRLSAPGLATAGTGDVLTGVIAALIARGMDTFPAACAGVLAHARAGVAAAAASGTESVIATDVIDSIPAGLLR